MKQRILTILTLLLCFAFTSVNAQDNYDATTMGAIVRHYETAKWSQGSPFNNQCWTDATQTTHAKTGCVPTAFAIIMRHHGFPAEGIGTLYNQQTGAVFNDRTYDYSKMPLTNGSGWTAEQQNEVAKLMAHLGHAFGVTYGTGETSVSIGNTMSERMQKYFNYNYVAVSNQYDNGSMYDFETWKNNLKNSLLNGCPVPYASNNQITGGRHMFIVDGFTENDYFHFNFGWGGGTDGWFKLDDITPTGDNYSWLNNSNGYDSKHQAYFNLSPNVTKYDVTATVNDSNMGAVSINGGTEGSTVTASLIQGVTATLTAHPAEGYALANWTKNDVVVGSRNTLEVKVGTDANDYVANFDDAANVLVVKEYTVNPANGSLSGGTSKYSTWTSTDTQPALTLKATNASGAAVYAMSALSSSYKAYATAYDSSDNAHTNITYTLSVPEGYVITNYLMTYNVGTAGQISLNGELLNATGDHTLSAAPNAQTASFTLSVSSAAQQYITVKSIEVTIQSEGGGSTPEPEQPTDPLAGKYFRLKTTVNGAAKYMNVGTRSDNSHGNVNMVDLNEISDDQIFLFEQSGDGYKLKARSGNYIKCAEWNVNANTTVADEASVLLFEESGDGYLINWYNTFKSAIKYFNVQTAQGGDKALHPYSDGGKNSAAVWQLEEVIPSNEKTLNVTFSGASWNNEASSWWVSVVTNNTPAVTVRTTDGTPKIGYSTFNTVRHPYLLDGNSFTISLPANCKITGYRLGYKAHNLVSKSVTYTNGKQSTGIVNITQSDEEKTLTVTGLDNNEISFSVDDQTEQAGFIIKSLEITYVENEFEPLPFKAEIENWRDNNPNTHLGTITIGGTAMKLTPAHQTASELTMPVAAGTKLAFTRKYRGFEFNGFYIGTTSLGESVTLTAEQVATINETTPLVAKFTATDDVTLFYDDDEFSYRIPAIAKTGTNRLIAVSDYRHNLDDIGRDKHGTGKMRIDLVARTSDDNGKTWSEIKTIAAGDESKVGTYQRAYGDAAIAAVGQNIVVMAAAGDVMYSSQTASATNPNKMVRVFSSDNGANWSITDMTTKMYSTATSLFPNHFCAFFGSGKLAVDYNYNGTSNARIYGALLMRNSSTAYNNFVVYSDDLGESWNILGGSQTAIAGGDEPKVEILPNGQILLSARRQGGRIFRVFTYSNEATNEGSWGDAAVNGCDNGGSNGTNGEIICLDAMRPNGQATKILLQSQPKGGSGHYDRYNVTIWYKEVSAVETYTPSSFASGWTQGLEVCPAGIKSAYSTMALQENGEIAFFFEEAPCYGDNHEKGYSMVYVPLTIEEITKNNFLSPDAEVTQTTFNIELTDAEGNIYRETLDYIPSDVTAVESYLTTTYPFITLGENGAIADNTYTNTVTLPFKVSNANTTVWHNMYMPANGTSANEFFPIYIMANAEDATVVAKVSEKKIYGASDYNTLAYADKLSWAAYSVDNTLTFKFKNKLTGKFMAVNGVVSSGNADNVIYTDETKATVFTLTKNPRTNQKCQGDWAITSVYNGTTGYVCNTSASYPNATNYTGNDHAGAWFNFVEAPDYQAIVDALIADIKNFGEGEGKYVADDAISNINKDALATMPLNSLNTQATAVQTVKESYSEITLTVPAVNDVVPGSVKILGEEVSHKFVKKGEVTIQAVPAAGYRFVNWTRPAAEPQASAAARTAAARNSNVVSDQNPYTVTVSEALSLVANFEQIVVNATLTDAQGNTYVVQVSGFAAEITKDAVAEKLREAYPYITLGATDQEGNVIDYGVLNIDGITYTYTNKVELPFKVSKTKDIWHNIYWPSNTKAYDYPVYLSASTADDTYVPKVTDSYAYGDHPTYNTKSGNDNISWAIYNVNNGFEFIFKNKVTNKYIVVRNVADKGAQNVQYFADVEYATAFTIEMKPEGKTYDTDAKYALAAEVNSEIGYLCSTSATGYNYATHYNSNEHQGAWIEFKESPDYFSMIQDLGTVLGYKFGAGDGKYIITDEIKVIDYDIVNNRENITLNTLNSYASTIEEAMNKWPAVGLTINPAEGGTTSINGEENVVHKYVPNGYELPLAAVPAEGYHFVKWIDGTSEVETAEYTKNINGGKGDVIELTATFAKYSYTVNVSTNGTGGSAMIGTETSTTVEHGNEVTLTATPSTGYSFAGWYNGEEFVNAEANYTFTVTSDINYTARFNKVATGTVAIHIRVASTDGTTVTNDADGNVKAVINNIGQEWATDADIAVGADVELVASNDYDQKAYLFDGWYKNDVLVSNDLEITVQATEVATYEARFFRGCVVIGEPKSNSSGYVTKITLADDTSLGYDASNRAVVKAGTTVKINTWIRYGYETTWKDENDNIVGNEQNLVITIEKDVTYTATFEPASYDLTVSANDDSYGTVSATSGTSTGTAIKVGHNQPATITATAKTGYRFVEWTTKDGTFVSDENPYTVLAIQNVEDMVDVEYVAVFEEKENAPAGTYYRIAYEFDVPVETPANSVATRAAQTYTYTVTPLNGGMTAGSIISEWNSTQADPVILNMTATKNDGTAFAAIGRQSNTMFKLYAVKNMVSTFKYTLSVPNGYEIAGYSFTYKNGNDNYPITINCDDNKQITESSETGFMELSVTPNKQTAEFTLQYNGTNEAYLLVKNFTVTIQEAGAGDGGDGGAEPETEKKKFYVQSEAVSETNKAMVMTEADDAASIFYYAGNKLMSYANGKFVKEDGTARGLQAYGAKNAGEVTITENGDGTATIKAPSYLHAAGTSGNYYVDHCGTTATCAEHNFIVEDVTSLPVTISSVGYATFFAPVAVKVPAGVTAYYLADDDYSIKKGTDINYASMTPIKGKDEAPAVIPANTGVVLEATEAKKNEKAITYYFDITAEVDPIANLLAGTVAAEYVKGEAYVLSAKNGIGFYKANLNRDENGNKVEENGTHFLNNSHKSYLPASVVNDVLSPGQGSNGFRLVFGTTAIEEVEAESEVEGIYDLSGRKLEGIYSPGVYIVNGKKVLVK